VPACFVPLPEREVQVGVALSGGGSRAALFGAAGLQALSTLKTSGGASALEQVSFLSSVSGGSMAASYYVLKKPAREVKVLTPDGSLTEAWSTFFDRYFHDLSHSFGIDLFWRQLLSFRWLNSSLSANSLSEILREHLLGDATWRDAARREANGDSPGLIINTTLYNNGRRFAVTGQPSEAFHYDFLHSLAKTLQEDGKPADLPPSLIQRWNLLLPMTPSDLHINTCNLGVAEAVTGSASFPPLIGPISFKVEGDNTYWHVGDGGLYENQGIESLLFLFLKQLQFQRTKRALIVAFDSSFPFSVGERELNRRAQPFSLLSFDFSRIPSIMEERATTYQALLFLSLQIQGVLPDASRLRVLKLRHIDARWRDDLSDLPDACRNEDPPLKTSAAVKERLSKIPTRLRVESECDRQLLAVAAFKLVAEQKQVILDFLSKENLP